jgi:cell division septum initiation protein DivIVA
MEMTGQELRDSDLSVSFHGYDRAEVAELVERAAGTIEHLHQELQTLHARLATRRPAGEATPAARAPGLDPEAIQRTLIAAQKTADDAIADAEARAQQLTTQADTKAKAIVNVAESQARVNADTARQPLLAEITQAAAGRDALIAHADALECYAAEYGARLRRAIASDLDLLADRAARPTQLASDTDGDDVAASEDDAARPRISEPARRSAR